MVHLDVMKPSSIVAENDTVAVSLAETMKTRQSKLRSQRGTSRRLQEKQVCLARASNEPPPSGWTDPPPATGDVLIERVTRAIERELVANRSAIVGETSCQDSVSAPNAERRARTLAIVWRGRSAK